jgi:hypothetical protein
VIVSIVVDQNSGTSREACSYIDQMQQSALELIYNTWLYRQKMSVLLVACVAADKGCSRKSVAEVIRGSLAVLIANQK